jgi:hypothetical protein
LEANALEDERRRPDQWWSNRSEDEQEALTEHRASLIPDEFREAVKDLVLGGVPIGDENDFTGPFRLPPMMAPDVEMIARRGARRVARRAHEGIRACRYCVVA